MFAVNGGDAPDAEKSMAERAVFVDDGHFYSPIHDPEDVKAYLASEVFQRQCVRVDALLDFDAMSALWGQIKGGALAFPFEQSEAFRYRVLNNQFLLIDSTVASAMVTHLNPRKIVEIGCGWSSAAMFDVLERLQDRRLEQFVCIDPDMSRLDAIDPPAFVERRRERVQDTPLEVFESLGAGDILFIDSSHVLKAGSDVHYEYLHLLPKLPSGVIVHIHDVFYPFEYPRSWLVRERRAWNEGYLVDLMLSHSDRWEVMFFNHAMMEKCPDVLNEGLKLMDQMDTHGLKPFQRVNGSIWLRRR